MTKSHAQIKDTYRSFPDHLLESVVRMNSTKAEKIDRGLADGSIRKAWSKVKKASSPDPVDVVEHIRAIADANAERWAVANACRELLAERQTP